MVAKMKMDHSLAPDQGFYSAHYADATQTTSSWFLHNKKETLAISPFCSSYQQSIPILPVPGFLADSTCSGEEIHWVIIKLSNKKCWLETSYNGDEYEVHLNKFD